MYTKTNLKAVLMYKRKNKMEMYRETAKRIVFVGIVFVTLVLFIIACICAYDISADTLNASVDYLSSFDAIDVMANTSSEENELTEESSEAEVSSGELSSEISVDSSETEPDEGYMAGAVFEKLSGVYVNSPYCFVYNQTTNTILYEKNAYDKCYPASVTKLLTAAVALEYVPSDTIFTVGNEIDRVGHNSSMAYIDKGERYALKDLIYALLLPSGNDVAFTIAVNTSRYIYGETLGEQEAIDAFMKLCNDKLLEIRAYNTHFSCPDGYHSDDHYTTAYDMMLICLYSTSFDEITTACGTYEYYCKTADGVGKGWRNSNNMLNKHSQYYSSLVKGLKTGSTTEAGKCLATLAEKDGEKLYIVVLGASNVDERNNDTLEIIHSVLGY